MSPKRISVRPANNLEGEAGSIIVWVYHRKAQIQLLYPPDYGTDRAIVDAVKAWELGMRLCDG